MHIVRVTYTVKVGYTPKNQENISKVMSDLRNINEPGIRYSTYLGPDGVSFMHFAHFKEEALQKILFDLESFIAFQQELKNGNLETPPKTEIMTLVDSCFDIFK